MSRTCRSTGPRFPRCRRWCHRTCRRWYRSMRRCCFHPTPRTCRWTGPMFPRCHRSSGPKCRRMRRYSPGRRRRCCFRPTPRTCRWTGPTFPRCRRSSGPKCRRWSGPRRRSTHRTSRCCFRPMSRTCRSTGPRFPTCRRWSGPKRRSMHPMCRHWSGPRHRRLTGRKRRSSTYWNWTPSKNPACWRCLRQIRRRSHPRFPNWWRLMDPMDLPNPSDPHSTGLYPEARSQFRRMDWWEGVVPLSLSPLQQERRPILSRTSRQGCSLSSAPQDKRQSHSPSPTGMLPARAHTSSSNPSSHPARAGRHAPRY